MFIVDNLKHAARGWRSNPPRMIAQIIMSFIFGQGLFWRFGYDQLGVFMNPKKQFGLGERVAARVYPLIPPTPAAAWTIKVVEIATDFVRGPVEGALYTRHGMTPDAVADVFTQPLWSTAEAAEKAIGAIMRPERVTTPEGVKLSLACIYGNVFRLGITGLLLLAGKYLTKHGTLVIEQKIRSIRLYSLKR